MASRSLAADEAEPDPFDEGPLGVDDEWKYQQDGDQSNGDHVAGQAEGRDDAADERTGVCAGDDEQELSDAPPAAVRAGDGGVALWSVLGSSVRVVRVCGHVGASAPARYVPDALAGTLWPVVSPFRRTPTTPRRGTTFIIYNNKQLRMAIRNRRPLARRATHGVVSLTAGFLAGFVLFVAVGAATNDAAFSALVLAVVVAASRFLTTLLA